MNIHFGLLPPLETPTHRKGGVLLIARWRTCKRGIARCTPRIRILLPSEVSGHRTSGLSSHDSELPGDLHQFVHLPAPVWGKQPLMPAQIDASLIRDFLSTLYQKGRLHYAGAEACQPPEFFALSAAAGIRQ
jgi:hypothetical protein